MYDYHWHLTDKPIRLTQCCTQFRSLGVKILCALYLHYKVAFTFKWFGNFWNKTFYSQRVWIGYNIELAVIIFYCSLLNLLLCFCFVFFIAQAMRFPPKSYSKDLESLEVCGATICTMCIFEKCCHHNALCKRTQHCWQLLHSFHT